MSASICSQIYGRLFDATPLTTWTNYDIFIWLDALHDFLSSGLTQIYRNKNIYHFHLQDVMIWLWCTRAWCLVVCHICRFDHYGDVIMAAMASQITSLTIICSNVYSGADQREHQKLRVTGLCAGNSPMTGEFPAQRASKSENVSIWWRHHGKQLHTGYYDQ